MAVGKTLKETREEKGITIEEACKETKIRKKYILALENDDFSKIPGRVYEKAFLKTYAGFLGIDKDEILEEYQLGQQLDGVEEENLGRKRRTKKNKKASFFNLLSRITSKVMIIILIIILFGGVVGYNLLIMNGNNNDNGFTEVNEQVEEEVDDEDNSVDELYLVTEDDQEDNNENESETEEDSDNLLETGINPTDLDDDSIQPDEETIVDLEDEVDIADISEQETLDDENGEESAENEIEETPSFFNVIATGESWIRVVIDGEIEFEGIINDGDILEYEPDSEVLIRVGNAAAISVEYGEEEVGPLGGSGQVIEETFQL